MAVALLSDFRDRHAGETVVVCGCGPSLGDLPDVPGLVTVGVNDVGRLVQPTYLVVANPADQFSPDRWRHVMGTEARTVFSPFALPVDRLVRFELGTRGGTGGRDGDALDYTGNSPYIAVCLAAALGARRIGLIGVDFAGDDPLAPGSRWSDRDVEILDREYASLGRDLARRGIELVNLSRRSRLRSLPRREPDRYLGIAPEAPVHPLPLRIAVQTSRHRLVSALLDTLAGSFQALGHDVARGQARTVREVAVVWNGRGFAGAGPALFCEHGWIPREHYQVSWRGIHAASHHAPFVWDGRRPDPERRGAAERFLAARRAMAGLDAPGDVAGNPERFLLAALQIETDGNNHPWMPVGLRSMQAFVDRVSESDPPWPVLFKQHPADVGMGHMHARLRIPRAQDRYAPHRDGDTTRLLRSGRCEGVIALTSGAVHDALVWDVPAVALGRGVWPEGEGPFLTALPADWSGLRAHHDAPRTRAVTEAYVDHLRSVQVTLRDAATPRRAQALLEEIPAERLRMAALPPSRLRAVRRKARTRPPLVNVVVAAGHPLATGEWNPDPAGPAAGVESEVTTDPRPRADSWILVDPPGTPAGVDPARALIVLHDPPAEAASTLFHACAALAAARPEWRRALTDAGVDLGRKRVLEALPGMAPPAGRAQALRLWRQDLLLLASQL